MKTRYGWRAGILVTGFLFAGMVQGASATDHVGLIKITVLPTLGGGDDSANDINNRGVIVGYAKNLSLARRAVRWQGGLILDIGVPASSARSIARGINDNGEIVGLYGDPDEFNNQAFYWSAGTGVIALNRSLYPGKSFDSSYVGMARAINDSGIIVGSIEASSLDGDVPFKRCYRSLPVRWETRTRCRTSSIAPRRAMGQTVRLASTVRRRSRAMNTTAPALTMASSGRTA